ncbi:MAG: thioredoxin [Phyllobacteriaceae bacterium]|nr:thioredoxin [Phyllobacteriaceae bacterium]
MTGPTFTFSPGLSAATPAATPAAGGDAVRETTTRDFMKDVIEASAEVPVLVDFWAEWCGPCKQLAPVIEKVVRAAKGKVKLVKMNIDHHPEVADQLGIRSIPAVIAFKGGQPVDGFMGAVPESQVKTFIDKLTAGAAPSPVDQLVAEGEAALAAKDLQTASQYFSAVLQQEPDNLAAILGLADVCVTAGEFAEAKELLASVPPAAAKDPRIAALEARMALAEQSAGLGDVIELEARITRDPNDHQARFDLALGLAGKNHRNEAVDQLIEIFRRDRTWNDDGARKQLLTFFEAWGVKDAATLYGRRRLSSVLFS